METEFQLLNARLSEKADCLEVAEEAIWELFGEFQGRTFEGYIKYPDSFSMRDVQREYTELTTARAAASDPQTLALIDYRVRELLDDPSLPPEPQSHLSGQGIDTIPMPTGSPATNQPGARPRRYFSSTITGLE
jgi:hypothetical protein